MSNFRKGIGLTIGGTYRIDNPHGGFAIHDHSNVISYLKKELLKCKNNHELVEKLISEGESLGLKRSSFLPKVFSEKGGK